MYKRIIIFLTFTFFLPHQSKADLFPYVDFDESMQNRNYIEAVKEEICRDFYRYFKQLYEKNNVRNVVKSGLLKIPKIIHQIWLGSEFPEQFKEFQETWLAHHPDWEYKLWTGADVATFPFKNKDLFDKAKNFGEKADIWRYEILEQFGGVYVDVDFECLKPLDILHYVYDFYVGLPTLGTNGVQIGIGIIGARPHHPILQTATLLLRKTNEKALIILKTGPVFFTNICRQIAGKTGLVDVVLPASYFYPRTFEQPKDPMSAWLKSESFAVHHWAGSWLSKEAFVKH